MEIHSREWKGKIQQVNIMKCYAEVRTNRNIDITYKHTVMGESCKKKERVLQHRTNHEN